MKLQAIGLRRPDQPFPADRRQVKQEMKAGPLTGDETALNGSQIFDQAGLFLFIQIGAASQVPYIQTPVDELGQHLLLKTRNRAGLLTELLLIPLHQFLRQDHKGDPYGRSKAAAEGTHINDPACFIQPLKGF